MRVVYAFWSTYRTDVLVVGTLSLFAAFLRLYNLELMGWVPDTYDRLVDASRVAEGHFPQSRMYMPAMSLILVPVATAFPYSLAAIQAVIITVGILLVAIGYVAVVGITGDRRSAAVFALMVAVLPLFVYYSRVGLFDIVNTLLVVLSLFLLPALKRPRFAFAASYGLLLALAVNFRGTNAFLLPVLGLYWLVMHGDIRDVVRWPARVLTASVLVAAAVFVSFCAVSFLLGNWAGNMKELPLTASDYARNIWRYLVVIGYFQGAPFVVPLALAGATRLRRLNPGLFAGVIGLILVWPLAHAPLPFAEVRYMLPVSFLMFMLAVLGLQELALLASRSARPLQKYGTRLFVGVAIGVIAFQSVGSTALLLHGWQNRAESSSEHLFRQASPMLEAMGQDSLVMSALTRGLSYRVKGPEYLDLIDFWLDHRLPPQGLDELRQAVTSRLENGGFVYYLYSGFEEGTAYDQAAKTPVFQRYFEALNNDFDMIPVFAASGPWVTGRLWTLYRLETRR